MNHDISFEINRVGRVAAIDERRTTLPILQIGVRERWLSVSEKSEFMDEKGD